MLSCSALFRGNYLGKTLLCGEEVQGQGTRTEFFGNFLETPLAAGFLGISDFAVLFMNPFGDYA